MDYNFKKCLDMILDHEGGFVNHPKDPGGATNKGITLKTYNQFLGRNAEVEELKNISDTHVKTIYKKEYWDKNKVGDLPSNLRHIYYDMCINMGKRRAVKVLQSAANNKGQNIAVDGGLGPATFKAIQNVELERVRAYRIKYYANLVTKKPDLEKFYFGWFRRALEV